ncbi:chaperonin 10-like protein [Achaetomium macrosporum]|uniref:Chaperonin 10-like protein n=1 Tax=Achaetomium macrosporum TaxID=79813 RepID=A0AAN7C3X2_9PEZI|nr:chaperonin 10-like protein [Achaetomium macrosporum]
MGLVKQKPELFKFLGSCLTLLKSGMPVMHIRESGGCTLGFAFLQPNHFRTVPSEPECPLTYKQAVFKSQGAALTIEDAELQMPGSGEVLVNVEACGVCYSDMFAQHNIMGGAFPIVPGHEIIGHVAAVGDGVKPWKVGDRVGAGWHGGHDGTCFACKTGMCQMCNNQIVNGETKAGGYAEDVILCSEATVRVPTHVDAAKYAPALCAGMTVFNSLRHMDVKPGETVAVQGLGGLGHLAVQTAQRMGYRVVAIGRGADKEAFARQLGAHEYIDTTSAKLIMTTVPIAGAMGTLLKGLGPLGKLLILSGVPGEVPIDTGVLLKHALSVQVWPCGHATDSEDTTQFMDMQKIDCMVQTFPLAKANEAFKAMMEGSVRFRAVIVVG